MDTPHAELSGIDVAFIEREFLNVRGRPEIIPRPFVNADRLDAKRRDQKENEANKLLSACRYS